MAIPEEKNIFSLSQDMVEPAFREPYIIAGYRKPGMSFTNCIRSVFKPCNETFNVWSSAIFGVYFVTKFVSIFSSEFKITDPFFWPLLAYTIGIVWFNFMSAIAHAFNSMSYYWRRKCFFLDYAGVSIYSFSMCQAVYFYTRPTLLVNSQLRSVITVAFLLTSLINSMSCTYFGCTSTSARSKLQYFVRTVMYASALLLSSTPLFYRLAFCTLKVDCDVPALMKYCIVVFFLLMAAIFYVAKIPERWISGKFDLLGQSHNIFHIFASLAVDVMFDFVKSELQHRETELRRNPIGCPMSLCFLLMGLAIVMNLAICYLVDPNIEQDTPSAGTVDEKRKAE